MAKRPNTAPFWRFLFLLYCAVMLWLLFGRSNGFVAGVPYETQLRQNANLIPFYTIKGKMRNITLFVKFHILKIDISGFLVLRIKRNRHWKREIITINRR